MSARPDPRVRTIKTDEVRYPGANLPLIPAELHDRYREATDIETDGRLAPALDAGLAVEGRAARQARVRHRAQQRYAVLAVVAVVGLVLMAIGWRSASDRRAVGAPLGGGSVSAVVSNLASAAANSLQSTSRAAASSVAATAGPTPYFASYKGLKLRLPVRVSALTEVGFHQAAYSYALSMKTQLPDATLSSAGNHKGTGRAKVKQPTGPDVWLVGKVLRMWRARPGRPDTAADVGANPGTDVLAPVTGTIVKIKAYKLYGQWDDFEIHISPDGYPNLDIVMIHVKNLSCTVGERVEGGVTRVAAVRKLSDKFYDQLASYTKNGGNHVHIQVNDATDPTYKGLQGAIDANAPVELEPTSPVAPQLSE